jgi:hypothetical protein
VSATPTPIASPWLTGLDGVDVRVGSTLFACATSKGADRHARLTCWGNETPERLVATAGKSSAGASEPAIRWEGDLVVAASGGGACRIWQQKIECWGVCASPEPRSLPSKATAIAGGDGHYCAALGDGKVACWGGNSKRQLGQDAKGLLPVIRDVGFRPEALALGAEHSCALADGRVHCWGANDEGQRGCGGSEPYAAPCDVDVPCD